MVYTKCRDSQVAFPSGLVLQFIEHIAGALQFMYTVCKPPILHTNVHDGNCFLRVDTATFNPSFFLADLGYAVRQPRDTVAPDVYGLWEIAARLSRLPPHSRNNTDDAALDRVMKKLKDLADTSGGVGIPGAPILASVRSSASSRRPPVGLPHGKSYDCCSRMCFFRQMYCDPHPTIHVRLVWRHGTSGGRGTGPRCVSTVNLGRSWTCCPGRSARGPITDQTRTTMTRTQTMM